MMGLPFTTFLRKLRVKFPKIRAKCRCSRELRWQRLGSARVSRAGDGVSPSRTSHVPRNDPKSRFKKSLFRRDAETNTRDACATREGRGQRPRLQLLRAFLEGGGFAAQVRERFASEMERPGEENGMRSLTRLIECVSDRWSDGVGE
jgi:hypothetical protein